MTAADVTQDPRWPLWQRIAFRTLAVFFGLLIIPDLLSGVVPGLDRAIDAAVQGANRNLLHVAPTLVAPNGSGDTSWAWARLGLILLVTAVAVLIWSIADRHRASYARANWWFRTILRYHLASAALTYGIIKVFALQMSFPTLSQLATPLGDLLPMRLSWLFIGYSVPYQVFCGVMETLAGVFLLWRRSITLGLILAAAAFANVLLLNLAYDVPVKLYASQLLLVCIVLLAQDAPRLIRGLVLNQPTEASVLDVPPVAGRRVVIARNVLKAAVIYVIGVIPLMSGWERARDAAKPVTAVPLAVGVYDVTRFVRNGDTVPALVSDAVRWRDVIIDNARQGSIGTTDSLFWQRYRRGYFRFRADTATRTLTIWRTSMRQDSTFVATARYALRDSTGAQLWMVLHGDSLAIELTRSPRHFQLAERQFHWISEYNR
jgi:hypothetical protein